MMVLHFGFWPGTTGVHFAAVAETDPSYRVIPADAGTHIRVAEQSRADGYLWVESGIPSYPLDTHALPFPTGGYLIDLHLHLATSLLQAALFDVVFVAQRDFLGAIRQINPQAIWLPLSAPASFLDGQHQPIFDVGFVGQARPGSRRERVLSAVNARFGMNDWRRHHSVEEMRYVYQHSRVVVNDPINGDVNMRFFEAMASGAVVVSPALQNGSDETAKVGEHYVVADFDNIPELLNTLRDLLDSPSLDLIAGRARALVAERHTYNHRLDTMREALQGALLDAPVRSMSDIERQRHLASLAESTADERLALHAMRLGTLRDRQTRRLFVRAIAKSRKRRFLALRRRSSSFRTGSPQAS